MGGSWDKERVQTHFALRGRRQRKVGVRKTGKGGKMDTRQTRKEVCCGKLKVN